MEKRYFLKRARAADGFSLAEVMVSVSLLGLISFLLIQMTSYRNKHLTLTEGRSEEYKLFSKIKLSLNQDQNCDETLHNLDLNSTFSQIKLEDGTVKFEAGGIYGDKKIIKILSFDLLNSTVPIAGEKGTVELKVTVERTKISSGLRIVAKMILLQVETNIFNKITKCSSIH